ncbi:hypothetical protein [Pseudomonas sp. NPDC007930]|uniref:hypothetical protein n=1 Tax=Pseudomonas sp. NPDC007930 TaxID=3364417 RepID=UPI0036EE06B4
MHATAQIIDFVRYRQRRQAQQNAKLMWAMYAAQAGLAHFTSSQFAPQAPGKVRP